MLEKIKISVQKNTYDILIKDCQNFNFYKNENTLNKNLFLNTLIINYYERFSANEESFKDSMLEAINERIDYEQDILLEKLLNIIRKKESLDDDKKTEIINLKPTKLSEKQILFIENNLVNNNSISSYYRNLFTSYAHMPQNYRELIIFKDNYDLITEAIEKKKRADLTLRNGEIIKNASIYKLEHAKEELFNYVLLETENNKPITLRLSKIKYVYLLNIKSSVSTDAINIFERQIKYGVQYPFYSYNEEQVVVKMTERGKELFKKMYIYRPIPDKIEGNLYYFNCSHNQITQYFKRFGYDGIIIAPISLAEAMNKYYYLASKKYNTKLFTIKNNKN